MTAVCSGGTSAPKFGSAAVVDYESGYLAAQLSQIGASWAIKAIPFVGLAPLVLSTFCGTDPPAMPIFSQAEADALLNITFGADFLSGAAKAKDMIYRMLWYDACECTSGTLVPFSGPVKPAGSVTPIPASAYVPLSQAGPFYRMTHATTKVLPLGCGSPVPPTGWNLPGFDDSSWAFATGPTTGTYGSPLYPGYFNGGSGVYNPALTAYPAESQAPANPMPHPCEQFILRWRFRLGDVKPEQARPIVSSITTVDGGFTSGQVSINGYTFVALNALGWSTNQVHLLPNQDNLIAVLVNTGNTGSATTWSSAAGVLLALDFSQVNQTLPSTTPCCPPDPATQSSLDAILAMVTLIQRQIVPFSYIAGTAHTAVSGAGSISIAGLLGVKVDVTTLPSHFGESGTSPAEHFDLGYVTFGTADGSLHSERLEHDPQIMLPTLASLYTTLYYDLRPGVVVTITELRREF